MITKTAKEVLRHALQIAGVNNIGFIDFFNAITLLNNSYRTIYERIAINEDGYYDRECIFNGNRFCISEDMWMIKRVIRMQGDQEVCDLQRQAGQTTVPGQYYIRGNELIINNPQDNTYKIIYTPAPQTITVPEDPLDTGLNSVNDSYYGELDEDYFYYKNIDDGLVYEYNMKELSLPEVSSKTLLSFNNETITKPYLDGCIEMKNFGKVGEEENIIFYHPDIIAGEKKDIVDVTELLQQGKRILSVYVSDPYIAVTYIDYTIKIFNGWNCTDYNILASKGKQTKGKVLGLCTNDYTGKGLMFQDAFTNKVYYCSFVPDTILNYPEQADFSLLELMVAYDLSQMAGTESDWIENKLEMAKVDFERQLMRCKASSLRINNIRSRNFLMR